MAHVADPVLLWLRRWHYKFSFMWQVVAQLRNTTRIYCSFTKLLLFATCIVLSPSWNTVHHSCCHFGVSRKSVIYFICWSHILTMHYSLSHLHFPSWNLLNPKVLVCLVMVGETALQKCANFICRVSTYIMQSYMGLLLFSRFEAEVSVVAI